MKILFKTNITALLKVRQQLDFSQSMTHTQIILGEANRIKVAEATKHITEAMNILLEIKSGTI